VAPKTFFGELERRAGESKLAAMRGGAVAGNILVPWHARGGGDKPVTSCLEFFFGRLGLEPLPCSSSSSTAAERHACAFPCCFPCLPPLLLRRSASTIPCLSASARRLPPVARSPAAAAPSAPHPPLPAR
jgi:hypothetical protein